MVERVQRRFLSAIAPRLDIPACSPHHLVLHHDTTPARYFPDRLCLTHRRHATDLEVLSNLQTTPFLPSLLSMYLPLIIMNRGAFHIQISKANYFDNSPISYLMECSTANHGPTFHCNLYRYLLIFILY